MPSVHKNEAIVCVSTNPDPKRRRPRGIKASTSIRCRSSLVPLERFAVQVDGVGQSRGDATQSLVLEVARINLPLIAVLVQLQHHVQQ